MSRLALIGGLRWAQRLSGPPRGLAFKKAKSGSPQRAGQLYEGRVGKALHNLGLQAEGGVWWAFEDDGGPGVCQTDFLITRPNGTLVVAEVKLTWRDEAPIKLRDLYGPVVRAGLGLSGLSAEAGSVGRARLLAEPMGIESLGLVQITRSLTPDTTGPIVGGIDEIEERPSTWLLRI